MARRGCSRRILDEFREDCRELAIGVPELPKLFSGAHADVDFSVPPKFVIAERFNPSVAAKDEFIVLMLTDAGVFFARSRL